MFLVHTKDTAGVVWEDQTRLLEEEARAVWALHKGMVIRNLWFAGPNRDAVIFLEAVSEKAARRVVQALPLVKHGLLTYELSELFAYDGFERLMK